MVSWTCGPAPPSPPPTPPSPPPPPVGVKHQFNLVLPLVDANACMVAGGPLEAATYGAGAAWVSLNNTCNRAAPAAAWRLIPWTGAGEAWAQLQNIGSGGCLTVLNGTKLEAHSTVKRTWGKAGLNVWARAGSAHCSTFACSSGGVCSNWLHLAIPTVGQESCCSMPKPSRSCPADTPVWSYRVISAPCTYASPWQDPTTHPQLFRAIPDRINKTFVQWLTAWPSADVTMGARVACLSACDSTECLAPYPAAGRGLVASRCNSQSEYLPQWLGGIQVFDTPFAGGECPGNWRLVEGCCGSWGALGSSSGEDVLPHQPLVCAVLVATANHWCV